MANVEKLFNWASVAGAVIGGYMCQFLGGWDVILKALVALVILDYITGVLKGFATKTLSSQIGFNGLVRKIMMLIVIATAVIIQTVIGDSIPLREIVIMFFICNEGISLLENASEFVDIPEPLKEALIQIRDNNNGEV